MAQKYSILKSPKIFFFMVVLLLFVQAIVISSSVVSIIPLADFIIDSELSKPSIFTEKFINFFKYFSISPSCFFVFVKFFCNYTIFCSNYYIACKIYYTSH